MLSHNKMKEVSRKEGNNDMKKYTERRTRRERERGMERERDKERER